MNGARDLTFAKEQGQVVVVFALLLPMILTIGSVVMSVGNWYVLKRHLQTQVDAAALSGGAAFTGCAQSPIATTTAITPAALEYAGDTHRDPTPSSTYNLLPEDPNDSHVVLNSNSYWSEGDPTNGSTHDWTIAPPPLGTPCETKFLDVKVTDDEAPLLFRWIPLFPSPKARAKVEIRNVQSSNGVKPLGVPEADPEHVGVVFVNEDGTHPTGAIRGTSLLDRQATPPSGLEEMSVWSRDGISPVGINGGENFGVIVVVSRAPSLSLNGPLDTICGRPQTRCYGGDTLTSGISFIHAYSSSGNGSAGSPIIRDVTLGGGCTDDLSRPYFNEEGGCPIGITATIDFGTGTNDPRHAANHPTEPGVCARVSASPGGGLSWSGGVWTGVFTPAVESGANQVNLSWSTDIVGGCRDGNVTGSFSRVAKPYVSDASSGPVRYLTVEKSGGGLANSMERDSAASLDVTVGLAPPLHDAALTDEPTRLRFRNAPSQAQALDCINGVSWNQELLTGCPPHQVYDPSSHTSTCVPAVAPPDCITSRNGTFSEAGIRNLIPCATSPNRWDGISVPPEDDPRWVTLFVLDDLAFTDSGTRTYPIRRFGAFYITAASGLNCQGDDPPADLSGRREIWGHFVTYVRPSLGDTIPAAELCSFTDSSFCTPSLVE